MALVITDDLLESIQLSEEDLRIEMALYLYKTHKLSLGKASMLADKPKIVFQKLLADHKIPMNYGEDDFLKDLDTIKKL